MKKYVLLLLPVLILFISAFIYVPQKTEKPSTYVIIGNTKFGVEVASTNEQRVHGLSDRKELPKDSAMLFVFPEKSIQGFWMKNMHFPIDIIWIDENTIVGYEENAKPEGKMPTKTYFSPKPVNKVLEVNAGVVKKYNIEVGQRVNIELVRK